MWRKENDYESDKGNDNIRRTPDNRSNNTEIYSEWGKSIILRGELCSASVDGTDIEKIFTMKKSGGYDEELQHFITNEALDYLVERINGEEEQE